MEILKAVKKDKLDPRGLAEQDQLTGMLAKGCGKENCRRQGIKNAESDERLEVCKKEEWYK